MSVQVLAQDQPLRMPHGSKRARSKQYAKVMSRDRPSWISVARLLDKARESPPDQEHSPVDVTADVEVNSASPRNLCTVMRDRIHSRTRPQNDNAQCN